MDLITIMILLFTNSRQLNGKSYPIPELNEEISNAIKFSPIGKAIVISASKDNDKYLFSIKDQGPGFTVEDKEKMFVIINYIL